MATNPLRLFRFLLAGLLAVVAAVSLVVAANAQQATPVPSDDEVNAIAKQLYCPVCENIPLDVCGTQACAQWRELIRQKLGEGWDEDQIKTYFVAQYGDRVLATPPAQGLNWLVYIVPPAAFLLGVFILASAFRAWKSPVKPVISAEQTAAPAADDYIARLEEEVRRTE